MIGRASGKTINTNVLNKQWKFCETATMENYAALCFVQIIQLPFALKLVIIFYIYLLQHKIALVQVL